MTWWVTQSHANFTIVKLFSKGIIDVWSFNKLANIAKKKKSNKFLSTDSETRFLLKYSRISNNRVSLQNITVARRACIGENGSRNMWRVSDTSEYNICASHLLVSFQVTVIKKTLEMKIFILVLCIVFFALSQARANNNDITTVSRCNTTRTTIRQVLKTTMEELYHETIHNLEIIRVNHN